MLQNDYSYSHYQPQQQQQQPQQQQQLHQPPHHHSNERPKLFSTSMDTVNSGSNGGGYHGPGMHDFHQLVHSSNMTPQHHHMQATQPQLNHHHQQQQQQQTPQHQSDFDHEPIMMNLQHPGQYYAPPPMTAQMLHVSTDYNSGGSVGGTTPSLSGSKRSREELNMKEKKRMFKLNDRINQLKSVLDEAGVQSKKNKQSILDNTFHYVSMLRSNLLIAKQKAERAEKQADNFRSQVQSGGGPMETVFKRCFEQSSTPRVVVDLHMHLVAVNSAFMSQAGLMEENLMDTNTLRASLCLDNGKLDAVMQSVSNNMKPVSAIVQAQGMGNNISTLTLIASALTDDDNVVTAIEFSLVPFDISSDFSDAGASGYASNDTKHGIHKETSPLGVSDLTV
uniref:BHLH domain-containing protein n=1 Tax=Hyaloperonospora arabidopsidis (strain Emoy2) TaxID=559515 RepID=M4C3E3_HYAAE